MPYRIIPITDEQLRAALALRDLTDPSAGEHCMQRLVDAAIAALAARWGCPVRRSRGERVVSVADNYDRLAYPPDGPARDARYTRYVDDGRVLRSQMSACIPGALRDLAADGPADDQLVAIRGPVYRRDTIGPLHVGEPHQLDLWRLCRRPMTGAALLDMVAAVVAALVPGADWRTVEAEHPYTLDGLEVEVRAGDGWVELLECGLAHPRVLADAGLRGWHGLAMGIGLDRAVMLRKGIGDIRLLRSEDPRVAGQMLDLAPYRDVSRQPPARRDLSVCRAPGGDDETLGDAVRNALGAEQVQWVEQVAVLSRTPVSELPEAARARMGARDGQENLLVRVLLRHPTRSLAKAEANRLRDRVYAALHEGSVHEWANNGSGL